MSKWQPVSVDLFVLYYCYTSWLEFNSCPTCHKGTLNSSLCFPISGVLIINFYQKGLKFIFAKYYRKIADFLLSLQQCCFLQWCQFLEDNRSELLKLTLESFERRWQVFFSGCNLGKNRWGTMSCIVGNYWQCWPVYPASSSLCMLKN